jgi:mono/diheme cytochrome c family protein
MRDIRMGLLLPLMAATAQAALAADTAAPDWTDVSRIFAIRCVNCHAEHGASKGLRLDTYTAAVAGGEGGPVLMPGNPAASELVRRIRGESVPRMPFLSTPLPEGEIDVIVRWVEGGLPDIRH